MNRLFTRLLLLTGVFAFTIEMTADERWQTLRAINWVENPTNHTKAGRFGELGPYQFRPTTWRMHTKRPFAQAIHREASDEVAVKHYEWIKRNLEKSGIDASPFNIAMAWNSGVNNVLNGRVPTVAYDYATRVTNLVQTFKQRAPAATATPVATAKPQPVAPSFSLQNPLVVFTMTPDAPKFELVLPAEPEMPVVYTDRSPVAAAATEHTFSFTTAATLTPRFSL
jgi:hypothetical protein